MTGTTKRSSSKIEVGGLEWLVVVEHTSIVGRVAFGHNGECVERMLFDIDSAKHTAALLRHAAKMLEELDV